MIKHLSFASCLTLAAMAPLSATATTVDVDGAKFAERLEQDSLTLELAGFGVATYRIIFDVYAAALYLPPAATRDDALEADTPRRLEIEYFHEITAEDFTKAANVVLEKQHDASTLARHRDAIERFHALYRDVDVGDRYTMTYRPDGGTTLSLNGETLGRVEGGDFARLYFGIWLGEEPLSSRLRRELFRRL